MHNVVQSCLVCQNTPAHFILLKPIYFSFVHCDAIMLNSILKFKFLFEEIGQFLQVT